MVGGSLTSSAQRRRAAKRDACKAAGAKCHQPTDHGVSSALFRYSEIVVIEIIIASHVCDGNVTADAQQS